MPEIVNPYIAGNPVTNPEMFFGRSDVFVFVREALIGKHRDNVIILYGQRRTGKTSTLYQMHRHLGERYVSVLLDLHGLAMEGMDGFLWELASSVARALRRDYKLEIPPPSRASFQPDPRSFFENEFLNQVWRALGDRHLLLMLDEAIRLQEQVLAGKLDKQIFEYLRYLMQHYERLNFLFALGDGLESMTKEYSFLFSVGLYKKISFLERDAAVKLITQPALELYEVEPAARERILQITGGHPYYTQLVCHSVFQHWQHARTPAITVQDIDAVVDEAVERGLAVLKHVWEDSTPAEKAILAGATAAAGADNLPVTAQDIAQTLRRHNLALPADESGQAYKSLLSRDILSGNSHYSFTVDLQRLWIGKYERLEWLRDELGQATQQWGLTAHPAVAPPAPPPQFTMPEYPTPKRPVSRLWERGWLWAVGLVALLALGVWLVPQFGRSTLSPAPSTVQPTGVAIATLLASPTNPPASPTALPTMTSAAPPTDISPIGAPPTVAPAPTPIFGAGVKVVFTRGSPGCSTLGLMDLDRGTIRTFKPAPNNEEPTWSPDGMHFVASTGDCQNKEYRLTLFDAETGDTVPLETNCTMAIDPFWGDDDRIYFACGARTGNGDFYSVNPDGTDLRAMGISARRPTLSPDGKHIAYMRQENEVWRIWVGEMDAGGKIVNPKQMPFPQVLGGVYARQPKWNSNGTRLYFNVTDQSSLQAMALASVELETGSTNVSFITQDTNTPFVRPVCGKNNVCVAGGASGGLWLLEDVGGVLTPKRRITFGEDYGADVYP